jgi:predicted acyl esterase
MINRLQAADPAYPVWGFFGDVGHAYAHNPLDVWQQAHNQSNAFLQAALQASSFAQLRQLFPQPTITADTTRCVAGQTLQTFAANSFGAISTSSLSFTSSAAMNTVSSNVVTPESGQSDPIVTMNKCVVEATSQSDPNQASYTFPVSAPATLIGGPVVTVNATVTGTSAELAARLWDVDSAGNQALITRSVYRLEESAPSTNVSLKFELWPNAWQLCAGHSVKLELTQDDAPTWRPDNLASSISVSNIGLSLPTVPGDACVPASALPESLLVPALPLVALATVGAFALQRGRRRRRLR